MDHAGSALVSTIAEHWRVTPSTARAILACSAIAPVGSGWNRYRWTDIWRLEGELYVPRCDWQDFRKPLLTTRELRERDPEARAERTFRRYISQRRIPSIRLSKGVVRVRECVFVRAVHHV